MVAIVFGRSRVPENCYCPHSIFKSCLKEIIMETIPQIEPRNKAQRKQLERYISILACSSPCEIFVLKCILSFDWNRRKIIQSIQKVSFNGNMLEFHVYVAAPRMTVDYSVSNPFKEDGWTGEMNNPLSRMYYVYHKLDSYLTKH